MKSTISLIREIIALIIVIIGLTQVTFKTNNNTILKLIFIIIIIALFIIIGYLIYKYIKIKKSPIRGVIILINFHEIFQKGNDERDKATKYIKEQINEFRSKNKYSINNWNGFCGDIFFHHTDNTDSAKETENIVAEYVQLSINLQKEYRNLGIYITSGFENKKFTYNKRNAYIGECFEKAINITQMPISKHILLDSKHISQIEKIINKINTDDEKVKIKCQEIEFFDITTVRL
ncbi:MAG: hypothetical protein ACOYOE_13625 [Chlorobium sp.]